MDDYINKLYGKLDIKLLFYYSLLELFDEVKIVGLKIIILLK
jgi:hypothetical protein